MLQPFELLRPVHVASLEGLGRTFLVSQTYRRIQKELEDVEVTPILITDYTTFQQAENHKHILCNDRFAAIIDLRKGIHRQKLDDILRRSDYAVFWATIRDMHELEKKIQKEYATSIRRYLLKHTHWSVGPAALVQIRMQLKYGELLATIKYAYKEVTVSFEELEKYRK